VAEPRAETPTSEQHDFAGSNAPNAGTGRELLGSMSGADLYDVHGKRLGAFIELVDDGGRVVIRHDGVLVWRRRVLPAVAVAAVLPQHGAHGAVVLNVDHRTLKDVSATRIAPEDHSARGSDREPEEKLETNPAPYVVARGADENPAPATSLRASDTPVERHLLFVATPQGYRLIERDGPAPTLRDTVSLPDHAGPFRVMKLASSPLPDDERRCAYLEGCGSPSRSERLQGVAEVELDERSVSPN
jgi:hypothetical protein